MFNAIVKYQKQPTESFTDWQDFEELSIKPSLTICSENQFDASAAVELGYNDSMAFLAGSTTDKAISWGTHKNMTFETLTDEIYGPMIVNACVIDENDDNLAERSLFLANKGKCKSFSNYSGNWISVLFTEEDFDDDTTYAMFITDPYDMTEYNIGEIYTNGDKITIQKESLGQTNAYLVEVVRNVKITGCSINLDERLSCMQKTAQNNLYDYLGDCLPPWMNRTLGCNSTYSSERVVEYFTNEFGEDQAYAVATGFKVTVQQCYNILQLRTLV